MIRELAIWTSGLVRREDGSTAAEFGLLAAFFISFMLAIIDAGRLAWTLNVDKAATRAAARMAIVRPMISGWMGSDFSWTVAGDPQSDGNGQTAPSDDVPMQTCGSDGAGGVQCGPNDCTQNACDATTFQAITALMRKYDASIQDNNVEIVYQHVGLGVIGNPNNHDVEPLVTVRLRNMTFQTGALRLFGVESVVLPAMSSTLVGEHQP